MPLRLAILGSSPCHLCHSACCRQNGHDWSVLLQSDEERRRFRPYAVDAAVVAEDGRTVVEKVLPYRDGRCLVLGDDGLCTIYDDRPLSCRQFECVRHFNRGGTTPGRHGRFLELNPRVRAMLEAL
ncbi:MAG TPA: YkgJ family cysteine cluster protein [Humisphaera sp.]